MQHHHAHLASCLADNGEAGPVVGLACDGLGYGTDGALWGGEVMAVSLTGFRRLAHLEEVPLPGGATAIRQPWRMAAAWLRAAGIDGADLAVARRNPGWASVGRLLDSQAHVPVTTSVGRLFDAVAALVGVRDTVNYEGQAAIELEQAADESARRRSARVGRNRRANVTVRGSPAATRPGCEGGLLHGSDLVRGVVADLRAGVDVPGSPPGSTPASPACSPAPPSTPAPRRGLDTVALSGGVFQNVLLLRLLVAELEAAGLRVLTHSRVPPQRRAASASARSRWRRPGTAADRPGRTPPGRPAHVVPPRSDRGCRALIGVAARSATRAAAQTCSARRSALPVPNGGSLRPT